MARTINGSGQYKGKDGKEKTFQFEYPQFDNVQDAIDTLGEDRVLANVQRMSKLDAANVAREKARIASGDSTKKVMTEEEKARAKEARSREREILKALREKGVSSVEELQGLL